MDAPEFTKFFHHVLDSEIPEENRDRLKAYWARFRCQPVLYLSDQEIREFERERRRKMPYAGVGGDICIHKFGFRLAFFFDAPPLVLRTLVQHELIHADHRADDTVADVMRRHLRQDTSPHFDDPIAKAIKRIELFDYERLHENTVYLVNKSWGGDEDALRSWIQAKEQT